MRVELFFIDSSSGGGGTLCKDYCYLISNVRHFLAWKNTFYKKGGVGNIQIPNKNDSNSYNVLHDDGISLRGTFVIDEEFILRHLSVNDLPIGRNIDEVPKQIQYR